MGHLEDVDNRTIALDAGRKLVEAAADATPMRQGNTDVDLIVEAIYAVGAAVCAAVILAEHWSRERDKPL